jgi:predicted RNA-binding protein YlqC (UPF0109 family)
MPRTTVLSPQGPDYFDLVKFLLTPFLESPDSLKVDCEEARNSQRIWIRLAIESEEKGKVYGRGGRNIQAIRSLLTAAAQAVGQSIYLDVYESDHFVEEPFSDEPKVQGVSTPPLRRTDNHPRRKPRTRRPLTPRF